MNILGLISQLIGIKTLRLTVSLFKPANLIILIFLLYNMASILLQTVKDLSSAITISILLLSFQNIMTWCKEDGTTQLECIQSLPNNALYADFVFTMVLKTRPNRFNRKPVPNPV